MDERVLVEVFLPIADRSIDVYLPTTYTLAACRQVWMHYLEEKQITWHVREMLLYDASNDRLLDESLTVKENKITQGTTLICI